MQNQVANGTETTEQMELTEQTGSSEATDATQVTELSEELVPEEDLEPLEIPVYKESELFSAYDAFRLGVDISEYYKYGGNAPYLQDVILERLPTTAYRFISPLHAYAMYESDTGYRVYLYFDYTLPTLPKRKGYPIVIKDMLSYSDFAGLKVGDSIDAVEQVDGVVSLYKERYGSYNLAAVENRAKKGDPVCTLHYLKDGILRINYTMPEEGKLVISEMIFNEDYCLIDRIDRSVSHEIKDIDLPTA